MVQRPFVESVRRVRTAAMCALLSLSACAPADGAELAGDLDASTAATPDVDKAVVVSDVVGKVFAGYQGWFAATGDGSTKNKWVHWSKTTAPSPGFQSFELWPDVREFSTTFQTGYANLGNGQPAKLFSSWTTNTVDTQVKWMKTYGIDGAAVQRFGSEFGDATQKAARDRFASNVRNAAETHGRKFYIMYDVSSWTSFQSAIKSDWTNTIVNTLKLTSSSAYAKHDGKPVVNIWGLGFTDRPGDATQAIDVITWFQSKGCYVIGGVPSGWRTSSGDSKAGFSEVYAKFNMISPWTVGRFSNIAGVDNWKQKFTDDWNTCKGRGQDYQPVTFPGFAWSNWNGGTKNQIPRLHGDFMWRQFANIRSVGIPSAYVAMFDEFDEGTAIAKAAEDSSMIPTNQYFLTLDADGTKVSSDFYLRLVGDAGKMLRQETSLVWNHPTPHLTSPTPLPTCTSKGATATSTATLNAGECLKSADGRFAAIMQSDGNFALHMGGTGMLWSTGTTGSGANRMVVQSDGNAVVYASTTAKWSSKTAAQGTSTMTMQNDGNLVLRTSAGTLTWQSNTCCR